MLATFVATFMIDRIGVGSLVLTGIVTAGTLGAPATTAAGTRVMATLVAGLVALWRPGSRLAKRQGRSEG